MDTLGSRLKYLRKKSGVELETIAGELNCNIRRIQSYERDERNPSIKTILTLAEFYNVSTDYLLGLSDEMQPHSAELQQATGLSVDAVRMIRKINNFNLTDSLSKIIESDDFVKFLRWFNTARIINQYCTDADKNTSIDDEAYQGMIEDTNGKAIESTWFPGESQLDMCLLRASNTMRDICMTIMKGEKDHGKRNEEN